MNILHSFLAALLRTVPFVLLLLTACIDKGTTEQNTTKSRVDGVLSDKQIGGYDVASPLPYRTVSLTFDDGPDDDLPDGGNTSLMIGEYLRSQGIRATFFINGVRIDGTATSHPNYISQITAMGHRIANHTYNHERLSEQDAGTQVGTVLLNQQIIDPYIHDGVYLFRAPNDDWGQPLDAGNACGASSAVANNLRGEPELAKLTGSFCFGWDAHDWACATPHPIPLPDGGFVLDEHGEKVLIVLTPEECASDYLANQPCVGGVCNQNGVVQMHDRSPVDYHNGTDWPYRLVVDLVQKMKATSGDPYVFVPLDAIPGVRGTLSFATPTNWTTSFLSDSDGWDSDIGYYGSARLGDIDHDGLTDVCGRGSAGIRCARSNGDGTMGTEQNWLTVVSDSQGYKPPQYSTTFQLGDIDNDGLPDACMPGVAGYLCFKNLGCTSSGCGFSTSAWEASDFSDAQGWDTSESFYGSIQIGDVDGDGYGDICGRNSTGIICSLFTPGPSAGFAQATQWSSHYSNTEGWSDPKYGSTLRLARLDSDIKADICGRSIYGMWCALSTGSSFGTPSNWSPMAFDDAQGWGTSPSRYRSISMADVDGDSKADVCGRHSTGVVCAFSTGSATTGFANYRYVYNTNFGDADGWSSAAYGGTLRLGDMNGDKRADVCGRASAGLTCALAPTNIAEYDATLKTRLCPTAEASCDSGTFYEGRGDVHPETMFPNTLGASCADGSSGVYLVDRSIERLRVSSVNNQPFAMLHALHGPHERPCRGECLLHGLG